MTNSPYISVDYQSSTVVVGHWTFHFRKVSSRYYECKASFSGVLHSSQIDSEYRKYFKIATENWSKELINQRNKK